MHTVLSVQSQRAEHRPKLPSKTLCGQDSAVDHLRRSSAQEVLLSHDPLDRGELRFSLVVAANDRHSACRHQGRWLHAGTQLFHKFFCLSVSMLSLCFLTGVISSTLCLPVALGMPISLLAATNERALSCAAIHVSATACFLYAFRTSWLAHGCSVGMDMV